ncbi:DUF445 domain-containing protein [Alteromonadaceae bacterium M269]|nr:DUF445 domain-containing protein [Alteromonadaceae bacterium M269]
MNKSAITNALALLLFIAGVVTENDIIKTIGLFAISGAITNWLAVHMLFEKVPGFYGSGVIPERFEDFKAGIKNLMMEQFFSSENIQRVMSESQPAASFDIAPVIKKVDLSPAFDSLLEVIKASSFGQMLGMFGGVEALEPMRQPFVEKMGESLVDISKEPGFSSLVQEQLETPDMSNDLHQQVSQIVEQRLNELTPQLVKDIIQQMIREHLGWLVVWGGFFGGVIGALAAFLA